MGNCGGSSVRRPAHDSDLGRHRESLNLEVDSEHQLMLSYRRNDDGVYEKINYDWFNIPIATTIDFKEHKTHKFEVRNRGIDNDCFLVGIIKA
jgi:hypothetical protein